MNNYSIVSKITVHSNKPFTNFRAPSISIIVTKYALIKWKIVWKFREGRRIQSIWQRRIWEKYFSNRSYMVVYT